MDNLDELRRMAIFVAVVDSGSFTSAAEQLGMTKSGVSRHVSLLEEHVGAPLLARTTRRLSVTDIGKAFYVRCARMMAEADAALAEVSGRTDKPLGTLRVAAPHHLGPAVVAPALARFRAHYPELTAELILDDGYNDLVAENLDVAVRVGRLQDSSLIARRLAPVDEIICGAPAYLEARGEPTAPDELPAHDWIIYTQTRSPHRLTLHHADGGRSQVHIDGPIKTNSGLAAHAMVRAGAGLAPLPQFYVEDDLASGRLREVMPDWSCEPLTIHVVYVPGREALPKVRLFVDFLAEVFTDECASKRATRTVA